MKKEICTLPGGKYMNQNQLDWFRQKLLAQLDEYEAFIESAKGMEDQSAPEGDEADVADYKIQSEQQGAAAHRLYIAKNEIAAALSRIDSGEYGYCEDTGDEIGLPRLKANLTARLCIDAQERRELQGRFQR